MATIYIPDEIVAKILATGKDKQTFVKEAIEAKLKLGADSCGGSCTCKAEEEKVI